VNIADASEPLAPAAWITLEEAALRLRVSTATLRRAIKRGRLRAARVGGNRAIRLRPEWADAWLEATSTPIEAVQRVR
jgi:excisionase family DNA binding protein